MTIVAFLSNNQNLLCLAYNEVNLSFHLAYCRLKRYQYKQAFSPTRDHAFCLFSPCGFQGH